MLLSYYRMSKIFQIMIDIHYISNHVIENMKKMQLMDSPISAS